MDNFITYFFTYIELSMLAISVILLTISFATRYKQLSKPEASDIAVMYLLLFCGAVGFLWQAVFYAVMPQKAAVAQGYLPSPFEWQVSAAYVGIGFVALFGAFSSSRFRLAAILLSTAVLWGQATAKIYLGAISGIEHMLLDHLNVAAHIITPILLIGFYKMTNHAATENSSAATA